MTAGIHLLNKYLSNTDNVSGPVLGAGDKAVKKAQKLMTCGAYILVGVYRWQGRQTYRKEGRKGGRNKKERKVERRKERNRKTQSKKEREKRRKIGRNKDGKMKKK